MRIILAFTFTLQAIVKREVACKFQLRILDSLKSSKRSRSIKSWTVFRKLVDFVTGNIHKPEDFVTGRFHSK